MKQAPKIADAKIVWPSVWGRLIPSSRNISLSGSRTVRRKTLDPGSDAHEMLMGLYGGMSKSERGRIKIRVRSAMTAQAQHEGRFLGGRPPYGYRLADAGVHPNPGKAADGKRLHRLEIDPIAAPVVKRIFASYIAGKGLHAIAEDLTGDGIPSPCAHD